MSVRPSSPVDRDLQNLYDEVWRGFDDESQASANLSSSLTMPTIRTQPPPPPPPASQTIEDVYDSYYDESPGPSMPDPQPFHHRKRSLPRTPAERNTPSPLPGLPSTPKPPSVPPKPTLQPYPHVRSHSSVGEHTTSQTRPPPTSSHRSVLSTSNYGQYQTVQSPDNIYPSPPRKPSYASTRADSYASSSNSPSSYGPTDSYASVSRTSTRASTSTAATSIQTPHLATYTYDFDHGNVQRRPTDVLRNIASQGGWDEDPEVFQPEPVYYQQQQEDDGQVEDSEDEEDESQFVNPALLSNLAVQLKDKVPRGTHVKGSIPYTRAFTGKDIVSTIQQQIQRHLAMNQGISTSDRRAALTVARSLQSQLFFFEVEWGNKPLEDSVEDVYMFLDDTLDDEPSGSSSVGAADFTELPTGVVTMLTKCYSVACEEGLKCYCYGCPRYDSTLLGPPIVDEPVVGPRKQSWATQVEKEIIDSLPESEINRQTLIHKIISKEESYISDLTILETHFLRPLISHQPPLINPPPSLESFIEAVFSNIVDVRECNKRLLENLYVRQREQSPIIQRVGDVFLEAATEFRSAYPIYVGGWTAAEKRLREEVEANEDLKAFLEEQSRTAPSTSSSPETTAPIDLLKHLLSLPPTHLQRYPILLDAIQNVTTAGNPDTDFLATAIDALNSLQSQAQLRAFQMSMGSGAPGRWEWFDLVNEETRTKLGIAKVEAKRQSIIWELVKGEMAYVKDLENIRVMYINPLVRAASSPTPIIPSSRLPQFLTDVFHNYDELHTHHLRFLDKLHEVQREHHPVVRSVAEPMLDAVLNFRDAYMEYVPNYPIASWRIDEECETNPMFKEFVEQAVRHPSAHRLDMKNFINRPIPRLLRYELLLKGILDETPANHEDKTKIPNVLDLIKALGKDTEPGVVSAKQKVELWRLNRGLVGKAGEGVDLDLLDENRSLIYSGRVFRAPEGGLAPLAGGVGGGGGWSELWVLLFDNYLVMTKPKERDGITKYHINRRPIPLDLLSLISFSDSPTQRSTGLLHNLRSNSASAGGIASSASLSPSTPSLPPAPVAQGNSPIPLFDGADSKLVYPFTICHTGRLGGTHVLYAESSQARVEWKAKLEEALGLRKVVQDANKVFEIEALSVDTFFLPSMGGTINGVGGPMGGGGPGPTVYEGTYTGKVTCSVPFNTVDGRGLVAIGCAEGVWIGFRHDPQSLKRVLHLKMVTQCAMLEDFGIFLVLADKSLFAYHIEALVPSTLHAPQASQVPQKLNGTKDVHFFSVGTLHGKTLVIYMKKKGLDSIFRVLEPVGEKINERSKAPAGFGSRLGFRSHKSEWFRIYRDFFLPSESFDLIFLKAKIAILCTRGFEIMDLHDFKSVTIPQREDPKLSYLNKRCEQCKPAAMYRSTEDEFLLCYDEFGVYVDKHGDPSRASSAGAGIIEWEGKAERVALHSPYILLFDTRFIEVRALDTGRLVQIIQGMDIRCIWDGRGVQPHVSQTPGNGSLGKGVEDNQEARVHAVMNAQDPPTSRAAWRVTTQLVFELVPTLPLFEDGYFSGNGTIEAGYQQTDGGQYWAAAQVGGQPGYTSGSGDYSTMVQRQ